jgi:quaternary ammonium compound-resistance protein SugE
MSTSLAWLALVTAGLLDVVWAISMKYAEGYTRVGWSLVSLGAARGLRLPARASAAGLAGRNSLCGLDRYRRAVGTLLMGVLLFGETLSLLRSAASRWC